MIEKGRKIKIISMIALVVAILGLTVAFAALSQTLTINGSANMDTATWDIHFENLKLEEKTGASTITQEPMLFKTSISGFDVSVTKPGDKVVYTFDIVNNGSVDAVVESITELNLFIHTINGTYVDEAPEYSDYDLDNNGAINIADRIVFNKMIKCGLYYEDETTKIKKKDTLDAGKTKKVKLIVEYKQDSDKLPGGPIKI